MMYWKGSNQNGESNWHNKYPINWLWLTFLVKLYLKCHFILMQITANILSKCWSIINDWHKTFARIFKIIKVAYRPSVWICFIEYSLHPSYHHLSVLQKKPGLLHKTVLSTFEMVWLCSPGLLVSQLTEPNFNCFRTLKFNLHLKHLIMF